MYICGVLMCICICVGMEARDQCWISFFSALYFKVWYRAFYWTSNWTSNLWDPLVSAPLPLPNSRCCRHMLPHVTFKNLLKTLLCSKFWSYSFPSHSSSQMSSSFPKFMFSLLKNKMKPTQNKTNKKHISPKNEKEKKKTKTKKTLSLFCVGQLFPSMQPDLGCGCYIQGHSISPQLSIVNNFLLRGGTLCQLPVFMLHS